MTGRASPFAALTGAEKQIKWLEVQSIRLPYVSGSVDPLPDAADETVHATKSQIPEHSAAPARAEQLPSKPLPPREVRQAIAPQADFQKTRHRQYDAVIARMRQAELAAKQYHPLG